MWKSIDKRFPELRGNKYMPLQYADASTNFEEVIEDWYSNVINIIKKFIINNLCSIIILFIKKMTPIFFIKLVKFIISIFSRYYIKNNLQCCIIYYLKYAQVS
jgi:hypothetical protein